MDLGAVPLWVWGEVWSMMEQWQEWQECLCTAVSCWSGKMTWMFWEREFLISVFPITILPYLTSIEGLDAQEAFGEIVSVFLAAEAWSRITPQGVPPVMSQLLRVANWLWARELLAGRWAKPWVTEAAGMEEEQWPTEETKGIIKIRRLLVLFCCSTAQQQVKQGRDEHSLEKTGQGKFEKEVLTDPLFWA